MPSMQMQTNQHDESGRVSRTPTVEPSSSPGVPERAPTVTEHLRGEMPTNIPICVWGTHAIDARCPRFKMLTRRFDSSNSRSSGPRIHDVKMSRRLSHLAGRHTSVCLNGYHVPLERGYREGIYIHGVGTLGALGVC
jgi:hypothetical protein